MYVDKPLAGVLAVRPLSRLNRAHPQKHDTFVLDFADNAGGEGGVPGLPRHTIQIPAKPNASLQNDPEG